MPQDHSPIAHFAECISQTRFQAQRCEAPQQVSRGFFAGMPSAEKRRLNNTPNDVVFEWRKVFYLGAWWQREGKKCALWLMRDSHNNSHNNSHGAHAIISHCVLKPKTNAVIKPVICKSSVQHSSKKRNPKNPFMLCLVQHERWMGSDGDLCTTRHSETL